ncbi:MAG: peptidylprolyl isomerase [Chloroflexota bacterium]
MSRGRPPSTEPAPSTNGTAARGTRARVKTVQPRPGPWRQPKGIVYLTTTVLLGLALIGTFAVALVQHPAGSPVAAPASPSAPASAAAGPPPMTINVNRTYAATIVTDKGTIDIKLDPKLAPITVNNFVYLARKGLYNGLTFHRVVPNFVIQGGDPKGTGAGGPGYTFKDEPVKGKYTEGAVAMANSGPNTNGSQFFICIANDTTKLAPKYNLFGYVTKGMSVAKKIQVGDHIKSITIS